MAKCKACDGVGRAFSYATMSADDPSLVCTGCGGTGVEQEARALTEGEAYDACDAMAQCPLAAERDAALARELALREAGERMAAASEWFAKTDVGCDTGWCQHFQRGSTCSGCKDDDSREALRAALAKWREARRGA